MMTRTVAGLILASCLGVSTAHAGWSADATVERFTWHEHTAPIEVRENGPRYAVGASFVQPRTSGPLFAARASVWGGNVDYTGSFQFDATKAASGASTYVGGTVAGELRYRWPVLDATGAIQLDRWRRRLSASQREDYTITSLRLGLEHNASDGHPFLAGGGFAFTLDTSERATLEEAGVPYELSFSPGLGSHPYAHAGYRVGPRVTVLAYWDGMTMGRSNSIVLLKRGRPQAIVSQPPTDMTTLGLRMVYGW
jgi:hypothetical protein